MIAPAGFRVLAPGLGFGAPRPEGWRAAAALGLVVLVGLTGAGKSSLVAHLEKRFGGRAILPDRRWLTDEVILPLYRKGRRLTNRIDRFALTRRFSDEHPGGMAEILARLALPRSIATAPVIFDGLRGENEVAYACRSLPRARFIALTAPDFVRLRRLIERRDAFDKAPPAANGTVQAEADDLLGPKEAAELRAMLAEGQCVPGEVAAKLAILREERRYYDADRTIAALRRAAPSRCLVIDTSSEGIDGVAELATAFIGWA
jgi:hypothetical protein